jgi:hypothetical protein
MGRRPNSVLKSKEDAGRVFSVDEYGDTTLCCASCRFEWIHQFKVETFERKEDDPSTCVSVERDKVSVDHNAEGNPSARRQGFLAKFWCENCDDISVLVCVQHKGVTKIWMEVEEWPESMESTHPKERTRY